MLLREEHWGARTDCASSVIKIGWVLAHMACVRTIAFLSLTGLTCVRGACPIFLLERCVY